MANTEREFLEGANACQKRFFDRVSFKLGNGKTTKFWEDTWLGNSPLERSEERRVGKECLL